jgi:hypothetical protein
MFDSCQLKFVFTSTNEGNDYKEDEKEENLIIYFC